MIKLIVAPLLIRFLHIVFTVVLLYWIVLVCLMKWYLGVFDI